MYTTKTSSKSSKFEDKPLRITYAINKTAKLITLRVANSDQAVKVITALADTARIIKVR